MGSRGYHQVGGWRGHIQQAGKQIHWGEEKFLAEALAGPKSPLRSTSEPNGPIELVLGIKDTGASYLLLPRDEAERLARASSLLITQRPLFPDYFVSLSPIAFDTVENMKAKLNSLKPKGNKRDTSKANVAYDEGTEGSARGGFELNRVFYRTVQGTLNLEKYGLRRDAFRPEFARVCALTFSVWQTTFDTRTAAERLKNPRILDLAFGEVSMPSFEVKPGSVKHFVVKENGTLGSHKDRKPFTDGPSETLEGTRIGERISQFFSNASDGPTILFVFDKEATGYALQKLEVDIRSLDIRTLLPLENPGTSSRGAQRLRYGDHEERKNRRRSRSRSPQRQSNSIASARPREGLTNWSEFVTIDVQKLFLTMMNEVESGRPRPLSISGRLGIYQPKPMEWGAGLELGLLVESWKAMASGPAIDEQREHWKFLVHTVPQRDDSSAAMLREDINYDDYDPNDDAPMNVASTSKTATLNAMQDQYDPDDVSDYGSD